jgi:hypothetical protein
MILCHVFNSLARMDLRSTGPYIASQFIGGMAAPLFLFMAGMTFAFQMDSLDRRQPDPFRRWAQALRRAGYVFGVAILFRFTNWVFTIPFSDWTDILRVDILNTIALAMAALALAAWCSSSGRVRFSLIAAILIAAVAPLVADLPWTGIPDLVKDYFAAASGRGRFPFFPCASYLAFGVTAGTILKRTSEENLDRLMQWGVLIGFALIFGFQYLSNTSFSLYARSNFWIDSPVLIFIRTGICLVLLAAAYLWTSFAWSGRWSWLVCLGQNSLMVYWIHVIMVYGAIARPFKRTFDMPQCYIAFGGVTLSMVGLSAAWLAWKAARAVRRSAKSSPATVSATAT